VADEFPSGLTDFEGSQIAYYELAEEIGRGGMAVVYRARDARLDRWVALKVLSPQFARDEAFRQRFIRESRTAAAVDHPNIIPIFDAGEAGGVLFIAMRYVAGQDVHSLLHRAGPLPAARALGIITQVAAALDAAHACGLVHRDVKPANMLLGATAENSTGDHVYLSDFGISKAVHATSSLTLTGQVLGTLNYLAPEQVEGRTVDGRADGYALACAAFEMLAGSPPFRRDENLAVMWAQVSAPPPPLTEQRPDLPPAVDRVMARALAKSPGARYQTCLAFAAALQEACRTTETAIPNGTVPAGPGRRGAPPTMADVPAPRGEAPVPAAAPASHEAAAAGAAAEEATLGAAGAGAAAAGAAAGAAPAAAAPAAADPAALRDPGPAGSRAPAARAPRPASPAPRPGPAAPDGPAAPFPRSPADRPPPPPPDRRGPAIPRGPVTSQLPVPPRPPRRHRGLVIVLVCVLAALIGGGAVVLSRRGSLFSSLSGTPTSPTAAASTGAAGPLRPEATVRAYYAAISARRYLVAWHLGAMNLGGNYAQFVAGYSHTQRDVITLIRAAGDVVTARFTAVQTDGTVQYFAGSYVVQGGEIVRFLVNRAG